MCSVTQHDFACHLWFLALCECSSLAFIPPSASCGLVFLQGSHCIVTLSDCFIWHITFGSLTFVIALINCSTLSLSVVVQFLCRRGQLPDVTSLRIWVYPFAYALLMLSIVT